MQLNTGVARVTLYKAATVTYVDVALSPRLCMRMCRAAVDVHVEWNDGGVHARGKLCNAIRYSRGEQGNVKEMLHV